MATISNLGTRSLSEQQLLEAIQANKNPYAFLKASAANLDLKIKPTDGFPSRYCDKSLVYYAICSLKYKWAYVLLKKGAILNLIEFANNLLQVVIEILKKPTPPTSSKNLFLLIGGFITNPQLNFILNNKDFSAEILKNLCDRIGQEENLIPAKIAPKIPSPRAFLILQLISHQNFNLEAKELNPLHRTAFSIFLTYVQENNFKEEFKKLTFISTLEKKLGTFQKLKQMWKSLPEQLQNNLNIFVPEKGPYNELNYTKPLTLKPKPLSPIAPTVTPISHSELPDLFYLKIFGLMLLAILIVAIIVLIKLNFF